MLTFILAIGLVFVPLAHFVVLPYAKARASPGFITQQVEGWFFGAVNGILGMTVWINVYYIGFTRRFTIDLCMLVFAVIMSLLAAMFFLGLGLWPDYGGLMSIDLSDSKCGSTRTGDFIAEIRLAESLQNMLCPGWLFIGFIIGELLGTSVPIVQNYIILYIVFVLRCLPEWINEILVLFVPWNPKPGGRIYVRQVERVFEPRELCLAWDYAPHIINTSLCLLTLFML